MVSEANADSVEPVEPPSAAGQSGPALQGSRWRRHRRGSILLGVLVALLAVVGFAAWKTSRNLIATDRVRDSLEKQGISVIYLGTEEDASPLHSLVPARTVRIQSAERQINDHTLKEIGQVNEDLNLVLCSCPISDDGLAHLRGKPNVRWLNLNRTKITNDGLKHLKGMNLELLDLSATKVDDAGLAIIAELDLPRIKAISVESTAVTNEGLARLKNFSTLEFILVGDTRITREAIREMKSRLPEATIIQN
jgi:hypothetical protein